MTLMDPLARLQQLTDTALNSSSTSSLSRCTCISAVKCTLLPEETPSVDQQISLRVLPMLANALGDKDVLVQRSSLITVNTLVHNKSQLVRNLLRSLPNNGVEQEGAVMFWLYRATQVW